MKAAGQSLVLHGWEMLQGTLLQVLAAFSHVLGRGWAKGSEGKTELSGLAGCLGEGDNWYKELESRG